MVRSGSAMELSATLLVLFHLSMHVVDEGHAVNPSCTCLRYSSTYGKERATFSSPDYPHPYPPRIDCLLYTFVAAPHEIVELIFTDFDIYKEHLDCTRGDFLKVYWEVQGPGPPEAVNERSAWARELCGSRADAPTALYSPGPSLILEFHSSSKHNNATGFVGTYSFIDRQVQITSDTPSYNSAVGKRSSLVDSNAICIFDTDGVRVPGTECDYQFSRSSNRPTHGRLYSPRYPSIYPNNVRCSYHFHARPKERIKIVFEEVSLQKGDVSCLRRADIIKVFDGRDTNSPTISMLCNELTGYEVLSTGPALLIQFTANSVTPGQGFAATFLFQPPPDSTAADSDRLLKLSFGKAFESLGPEVSATNEPEPVKKRSRIIIDSDSEDEVENTPPIDHIPSLLEKMGHVKAPENTLQINNQMKDLWNNIIKNGLDENTKNDISKKIPKIIDCLTPAPQLNPEIQAAMTAQAVTRDNHLCEKQNLIGTVICGLTDILHKNPNQDCEYLGNCIRLLCHIQYKESQTRRAVILPGLNKKVKDTLQKTEINNFLFGKDINIVLKENKNIENSVKDLKNSLNNWGPSSYRKQGGGQEYNRQPQLRPQQRPQSQKTAGKPPKSYQHHLTQRQQLRSMTKQPRTFHSNRGRRHY